MKPFVGYTRRPEPKWPYLIIAAVIIFIFLLFVVIGNLLISFRYSQAKPAEKTSTTIKTVTTSTVYSVASTTTKQTVKEEISPKTGTSNNIKVENIFFTSNVDGSNQPLDRLEQTRFGNISRLYCYTKIISNPPQTLQHVWIGPQKKVLAEIVLHITNNPAYTWSYIGLGEAQTGEYTVQVKDKNGVILSEKSILVSR